MKQRVFITGIGIVASIGLTTDEFWKACLEGKSEVAEIPAHWNEYAGMHSTLYAPLPTIDFSHYPITKIEQSQLDKHTLIALIATFQALQKAGLQYDQKDAKKNTFVIKGVDPAKSGIMFGTGISGISSLLSNNANHLLASHQKSLIELQSDAAKGQYTGPIMERLQELIRELRMPPRFNPFVVSMGMPNGCADTLGIKFSLEGINQTFCSACASGTSAVGHAFRTIADSKADLLLCGGSEYLMDDTGGAFRGFDAAKTLVSSCSEPSKACRPFDMGRSGFLFSEGGAAALVLESEERMLARGAKPYAEIAAFAESYDAYNIMMMEPSGKAIRTMVKELLKEANLKPEEIDYLNTHGTGTIQNDEIESQMISDIFGKKPILNSTKSLIGHTLGASGAIEASVTALSLQNGTVHPSLNIENPVRDLNFARTMRHEPLNNAMTQSFAFGGHNAGLILTKAS